MGLKLGMCEIGMPKKCGPHLSPMYSKWRSDHQRILEESLKTLSSKRQTPDGYTIHIMTCWL